VMSDPVISTLVEVSPLKIELGGILTVASAGQLTVAGLFTNDAGAPGLVLESGASLIHVTPGITGTVKRNIADDNKWHFLSCPINQATMPAICDGNFAPATGDFNATTRPTFDFFFWYEAAPISNANWINLKNADGNVNTLNFGSPPRFVTGVGYLVEYDGAFAGDPEKTFTGTLGIGSINIPVTAIGNSYNLIGNTYPSSIDWKAASGWDRTPLEDNAGGKDLWIWNDAVGNYGVYNSALPGDAGTNGVSRNIPPEQGYFVKAAASANVKIDDDIRCHSTQAWLKSDDNTLRISASSALNTYSDEVLLAFNAAANGGSDKMFSFYAEAPGLYFPVSNNNYSIRFLSEAASNTTIPLSFKAGKDGDYILNINGTAKIPDVYLQDLKTGSVQDVKAQPVYTFTSSNTDEANRFLLKFSPLGIDPKQSGHDNIFVYNNVLNVNNPGESVIMIYNMMGIKIMERQTKNETLYQLPLQVPAGYYLITMTNGNKVTSEKVYVK
jgi:hypothetical protein